MVRWTEEDDVRGAEDIYSFQTEEEAKAFQFGLIETETKLEACPTIHEIHITKWPVKKQPFTPGPMLQLLFSVFIGVWSAFWWHLFKGPNILVEYLLVGLIASLLSYLTLILFGWYKSRKEKKNLL